MIRIPVRCRAGGTVFAIVDDEDAHLIKRSWRFHNGYAITRVYAGKLNGKSRQRDVPMHRMILGLAPGDPRQGDHRDRDTMNNQRANLCILSQAQNAQNVGAQRRNISGFRGVQWDKRAERWKVCIRKDNRTVALGYYDDPQLAACIARDARRSLMPYSET